MWQSLQPTMTKPSATAGEDVTAALVGKAHRSCAELTELLLVVVPLWLTSWRKVGQSPPDAEAADVKHDRVAISSKATAKTSFSFLISHPYRQSHVEGQLLKLLNKKETTKNCNEWRIGFGYSLLESTKM